jgi:hypothetical protein
VTVRLISDEKPPNSRRTEDLEDFFRRSGTRECHSGYGRLLGSEQAIETEE